MTLHVPDPNFSIPVSNLRVGDHVWIAANPTSEAARNRVVVAGPYLSGFFKSANDVRAAILFCERSYPSELESSVPIGVAATVTEITLSGGVMLRRCWTNTVSVQRPVLSSLQDLGSSSSTLDITDGYKYGHAIAVRTNPEMLARADRAVLSQRAYVLGFSTLFHDVAQVEGSGGGVSAEQAAWLAGYVAGYLAAVDAVNQRKFAKLRRLFDSLICWLKPLGTRVCDPYHYAQSAEDIMPLETANRLDSGPSSY